MKMDITTREILVLQRRADPAGEPCPRCGGLMYINPPGGPDSLREVGCYDCPLVGEFFLDDWGGWLAPFPAVPPILTYGVGEGFALDDWGGWRIEAVPPV